MRALHIFRCGAVLGFALVATRVAASPLLELAGGQGGLGGFQPRTVQGGAAAAYFNPALLTGSPAELTVGFDVLSQQIGISLDARPGNQVNLPNDVQTASHADGSQFGNYPIPTDWLEHGRSATALVPGLTARPRQAAGSGHSVSTYEVVGLTAQFFRAKLALGFYGMIPNGSFTKLDSFYDDEREQYFTNSLHPELYSDRMQSISLGLGAGWKVSEAFSVGLGSSFNIRAAATAPAFVADAGHLENILLNTDVGVHVAAAPYLGLSYDVSPKWRLTGTVHAPQRLDVNAAFTFLLGNGIEQSSSVKMVYDYMPWQIGGGTTYEFLDGKEDSLMLAGTALLATWSSYVDRHGEQPIPAYAWADTVTGTVGTRFRHGPAGAFVDLEYAPTPVPLQTGRSSDVDNDRLGLDCGVNYAFSVEGTAFRVGAQLATYWLVPRHQSKLPTPTFPDGQNHTPALVVDELPDDAQSGGTPVSGAGGLQTNNPGWPGFGSEGWVLNGSVYLAVAL